MRMDATGGAMIFAFLYLANSAIAVGEGTACTSGEYITLKKSESKNISSPGFDQSSTYPSDVFCHWTIRSTFSPNRRISFNFEVLSIWPTYDCVFDGVVLFDGNSTSSPILGKYCRVGSPMEITTSGPSAHIVFYSGDFVQRRFQGFILRLTDVDSPVVCNDQREISCHNGRCVNRKFVCNREDDCGDGTDEESCGYPVRHSVPCGLTPIAPVLSNEDRIVGGRSAIPGSWPWQCSLQRRERGPYGHLCGAVLLNDQWLLTAAHCFRNLHNASLWTAHLGKYHKAQNDEDEQMRYLKEIVIHPKYSGMISDPQLSHMKDNDVALVRLNAPVTMKNHIRPVCLPPLGARVPPGTLCHVTGWGVTYGTGHSDVLKQAMVPVVPNKTCRQIYQGMFNVTASMICAGFDAGGHDSCKGDSGGPLVLTKSGRWYLVGVVSTGGNCAATMQPGVYMRVSSFKWWILQTMWRRR